MTADYTLKLKNGTEIPLLYNTWAFKTYSERKGIEYEDLANGCMTKEDGSLGETLRTKNLPGILLIGAEAYTKYNNQAFTYTDLDACLWMDDFSWINSPELAEVLKYFTAKLWNIDPDKVEVEAEKTKKKKS